MKKSYGIPLVRPSLSDADIATVVEVIKSGRLVNGPMAEAFERQLASFLDVRYAVCLSSGTAALHLGLLAIGVGRGDEVIVPAFSYPASANAVELCGARVIFVDSGSDDFNIDAGKIESNIGSNTRAIMVVHNFGWPCAMDSIRSLSAKYGLPIIEDAACALGSGIGETSCGNFGRLAAFSFHPRKILTTGEGGAVVTDDPLIAERIRELRNHGQALGKKIEFVAPGFNYRMGEMQAALGVSQMKRFKSILRERQRAARYYDEALGKISFLKPRANNSIARVNYQTYVARVSDGLRNDLIKYLAKNGIEAGIGTYSIPHTTYYSERYGYGKSDFPHALDSYENLISLPLYDCMTRQEQDSVIEALNRFVPEIRETADMAPAGNLKE